MDNKLYKMMNWPEIEGIVFSECDHPHEILGKHTVSGGTLIQCFFPGASKVKLVSSSLKHDEYMEMADEEGFFAYWSSEKNIDSYYYIVSFEQEEVVMEESYAYLPKLEKANIDKFTSGTFYDIYDYFGAHQCTYKEKNGVSFMVYAPNVQRVSVVGDFNNWDGRTHQMSKICDEGIYSIFIPKLRDKDIYKYEIKLTDGTTVIKRDPFSFAVEKYGDHASEIRFDNFFSWSDSKFCAQVLDLNKKNMPLCLGDYSLSNLINLGKSINEISKDITEYIKSYHYKALVIDNVSKELNGTLLSFFSTGALSDSDMKYLVNSLHENNIPVLLTLDLSSFCDDIHGLKRFNGQKLFEDPDDRPIDEKINFNFNNVFVRNYGISVLFYFIRRYHVDGFVLRGTDRTLYLNYNRAPGDHSLNMYGTSENLGGEEFIKHLNSILHKKYPQIITIAGDSLMSNSLTQIPEEGGFGFDYKYDNYFHEKLFEYFSKSEKERLPEYSELINLVVNAFLEDCILIMPRTEYGIDEEKIINAYGNVNEESLRNFRTLLTLFFCLPGRKCLPFTALKNPDIKSLLVALNDFYTYNSALFEYGNEPSGFLWENNLDEERLSISFYRKSSDETLLILCNFSNSIRTLAVKADANEKYTEIFNSNLKDFGGELSLSDDVIIPEIDNSVKKTSYLNIETMPNTIHIFKKLN